MSIQYTVVMLGGSVGKAIHSVSQLTGTKAAAYRKDLELFETIEDAKEKAKRMNKALSPGEKKYYRVKYVVVPVIDGVFASTSQLRKAAALNEAKIIENDLSDIKEAASLYESYSKKIENDKNNPLDSNEDSNEDRLESLANILAENRRMLEALINEKA